VNLLSKFAGLSLAVAMMPAGAAMFDFANLKYINSVNTGFLPTDGISCTGGDLCSSNVDGGTLNGDLTFVSGGITVRATGTYNGQDAAVVQDKENNYNAANKIGAGLGVYHQSNVTSDDNITFGESLLITFDQVVNLTSISLRSEGHNVTGWASGSTFLFNGVSTLLPLNVGDLALNLVGTQFRFSFGGAKADQFYLSGLTANRVPEPGTLALALTGLAGVGVFIRRRRPVTT